MKAYGLEMDLDDPFGYAQGWVNKRSATLVRIETAEGRVGWGECWGPVAGNCEIVNDFLGPLIKGTYPSEVQDVYETLYEKSRAAYQTAIPFTAISGIDIALWDLYGKQVGESISSLLDERRSDHVRTYATGHYFYNVDSFEEQFKAIRNEAVRNAERFDGIKLKIGLESLGFGSTEDLKLVEGVLEAVDNETTVMVDANYAYDMETALKIGKEFGNLGVRWFEEPVRPENFTGYKKLRKNLEVDISAGECHNPYELNFLLENQGLDIAQPDVCNVGGITPAFDILSNAADRGITFIPHVWGTPVALAASLQLSGTLRNPRWFEFDTSTNPLRDELSLNHFVPNKQGRLKIPNGYGLGVDINENMLSRYAVN